MRFLVTAANGDIGDSIGRILKEQWPSAEVHGADMVDCWPGQASFDAMHLLPSGDDAGYPEALSELTRLLAADIVIPVSESELSSLAHGTPMALPLVMPPASLVRVFLDKIETVNWLEKWGLPAPQTVPLSAAGLEHLPVIVKTICGHGNRGYPIVHDADQLASVKRRGTNGYLAQALVGTPDQEYTCAVVRLHGAVRTLVMLRRLDGSSTIQIEVVHRPEIEVLLKRIAEATSLDGSINVQLRLTSEGPMIFEINPRFSGTVMMRHRLGFQDLLWTLAARKGEAPPPYEPPIGARVFRMPREVVAPPLEKINP